MIIKGQMINERYQIIKMIGEGGMANVYLAQDVILDRKVAVKVLRGDLADDEKFVRRFQREAISASSLSHPNIIEMYDVGEDNGKYFIVMEYVEGKTLKNLIKRRGALTLHEIIDIMLQLTSAISHAHASYIIHRDIKPQNVMIIDDGTVKITDFGIAMALKNNELTQTNSIMGTVYYLPPEHANGSGSTIKSDIYSLGILMYELITGKIPFRGENAVEIAIKQMREQIPSVCAFNPDIPQSIENIILKASAKNPKNRYDSVTEMYEDLKVALNDTHKNEKRIVYKYPESDLEETKKMPVVSEAPIIKKEEINIGKEEKIISKPIIILASIALFLAIAIGIAVIVYPKLTEIPEIRIPDVANLSVVDAENKLREEGFKVNVEIEEKNDNSILEGKVIGTKPRVNAIVKEGTEITLIVSIGATGIALEDYVGKNYYEVKAILEAANMYVLTEKKEVEDVSSVKENVIIDQNPKVGTKLAEGDTVTLIIPDIITKYPDFTDGSWNVNDIQIFAQEYSINLNVEYKETSEYGIGTIISQSRVKDSRVMSGASLKIVVAKEISEEEHDEIEEVLE